jgi:hypothetical protein
VDTLKNDIIEAINKLPESATIDEIMYRLYVIDKVRKGKEAVKRGETVSVEEIKKGMEAW